MTVKFAPIDDRGYRIPVAELSRKDLSRLMALDASSLDREEKDPEGTNTARPIQGVRPGDPAVNKERHFVQGGLRDSYADDDDLDDDLDEDLIEALCEHAGSLGVDDEVVERLRGKLSAKQAQDDPPAFRGQPLRGGSMRAMDAAKMAMDVKAKMGRMSRHERDQFIRKNPKLVASLRAYDSAATKSFAQRFPEAARISGDRMTNKRDVVPPSLAMDRSRKAERSAKSFADRHPDAARIRFSY